MMMIDDERLLEEALQLAEEMRLSGKAHTFDEAWERRRMAWSNWSFTHMERVWHIMRKNERIESTIKVGLKGQPTMLIRAVRIIERRWTSQRGRK